MAIHIYIYIYIYFTTGMTNFNEFGRKRVVVDGNVCVLASTNVVMLWSLRSSTFLFRWPRPG